MSKDGWFDKLDNGLFLALTFLNKRYEIQLTPPLPFVKFFHKIPVFFEGWLPLCNMVQLKSKLKKFERVNYSTD